MYDQQFQSQDISNATFTVSDLTLVNDVSYQMPIIPAFTSAILGISLNKTNQTLNFCLVYDHQMSSGKEASKFLSEIISEFKKYI